MSPLYPLCVPRRLIAAAVFAAALWCGGTAAYAEATPPPPTECSDPGFTCSYDGTQWNVDAPATNTDPLNGPPDSGGPNIGGMFALFAIFGLVVGGGGL